MDGNEDGAIGKEAGGARTGRRREGSDMRRGEFMQFVLDDEGFHAPDGLIDPRSIRVATIDRKRVREPSAGTTSSSPGGIVGGALAGGLIAGPVGVIAGGLAGSYLERLEPDEEVRRTVSATMLIESDSASYKVEIPVDRLDKAQRFVVEVRKAAGLE